MGASLSAGLTANEVVCSQGDYTGEHRAQCLGTHLLVELWSAPFPKLADARQIQEILGKAGACENKLGKTESAEVRVHQFDPYGVSGTASSPMAHILIHTWPENRYAAVDIFSHGRDEAYLVLERMKKELCPEYVYVLELQRGQLLDMEDT